jgi:hypothetical protein
MNPQTRQLIRKIIFIVWVIGFYILLGWLLFDFKPFPVSARSLYILTGASLVAYLALAGVDDKY